MINVVLKAYNNIWLATEERDFADELISALTRPRNAMPLAIGEDDKEAPKPLSDPLYQIIQGSFFTRKHIALAKKGFHQPKLALKWLQCNSYIQWYQNLLIL